MRTVHTMASGRKKYRKRKPGRLLISPVGKGTKRYDPRRRRGRRLD